MTHLMWRPILVLTTLQLLLLATPASSFTAPPTNLRSSLASRCSSAATRTRRPHGHRTAVVVVRSSLVDAAMLLAEYATGTPVVDSAEVAAALQTFEPRGITAQDSAVFAISIVPFLWATVEFWRRIAVGEPFGTGTDSVIIGEDANPDSSRGRRVLGQDAFFAAYVLFGVAGFALVLTAVAGFQVGGGM